MGYKRKGGRRGRRTKLTPEVHEIIIKAIRLGSSYRAAANYAGVSEDALYEWLAKGRETGRQPYARFADDFEKARAEAVLRRIKRIEEAAQSGAWQADAWWLERRYPEDWSLKHQIEHSGGVRIEFVDVDESSNDPEG